MDRCQSFCTERSGATYLLENTESFSPVTKKRVKRPGSGVRKGLCRGKMQYIRIDDKRLLPVLDEKVLPGTCSLRMSGLNINNFQNPHASAREPHPRHCLYIQKNILRRGSPASRGAAVPSLRGLNSWAQSCNAMSILPIGRFSYIISRDLG